MHIEIGISESMLKNRMPILLFWGLLLSLSCASHAQTYRVIQGSHPLDEYAVGALKVALKALGEGDTVSIDEQQVTQTRVMEEVKLGRLDIMWLASNEKAESEMLPIRFPLLKGLLGYRICIINPERQSKFASVRDFEDVKRLSMGQGYGWPDVDILRSNNLNVVTTSKYENLFYMVEGGRFDGFPRGVLEPWVEIANHRDLGLKVDDRLLLIYTLPFYLFVDPSNQALAKKIHRGLDLALASGEFDRYLMNHPLVNGALAKANLKERLAFKLKNPTLPSATPLQREEYWFDVSTR